MDNVIKNPFGNVRLQIVKLISLLLSMHNQQINERFAQLNTIKVLLVSILSILDKLLCLTLIIYKLYSNFYNLLLEN